MKSIVIDRRLTRAILELPVFLDIVTATASWPRTICRDYHFSDNDFTRLTVHCQRVWLPNIHHKPTLATVRSFCVLSFSFIILHKCCAHISFKITTPHVRNSQYSVFYKITDTMIVIRTCLSKHFAIRDVALL